MTKILTIYNPPKNLIWWEKIEYCISESVRLAAVLLIIVTILGLNLQLMPSVEYMTSATAGNYTFLNNLAAQENPQPQNSPGDPPEILFSDDFNDGDAAGWTVFQGDWQVVNGEFVYGSRWISDVDGVVAAGDTNWTDYVFESKFKLIAGDPQIYVLFRFTNYIAYEIYDGYSFQFLQDRWYLISWVTTGGYPWFTIIAQEPNPSLITPGEWYTVRVEAIGNTIKCYVNGELRIEASDLAHPQGRIGFRGNMNKLAFDDVVVRPLADLTSPVSSVLPFEGDAYWKEMELGQSFTVSAIAEDDLTGVVWVGLLYSYSPNNSTWYPWEYFGADTAGGDGWSWNFDAPNGYGYYKFCSFATDGAGNREDYPRNETGEIVEDSQRRVCRDLVRVGAILAKPSDVNPWRSIQDFEIFASELTQYYDEVSYGALAVKVKIYDGGGDWFELSLPREEYIESFGKYDTYKGEFMEHAIEAADPVVNYAEYLADDKYVILVVGASSSYIRSKAWATIWHSLFGDWEEWGEVQTNEGKISNIALLWEKEDTRVWAHEFAHVLGRVFTGWMLRDQYEEPGVASMGSTDGWDLMGGPIRWPTHLSSWNKEHLGWLEYQDIDVGWSDWIEVLPQLSYGGKVYRYWFESNEFWLFEVRHPNSNYSRWDTDVPSAGLVNYDVWCQEYPWLPGEDVIIESLGLVDGAMDFPGGVIIKIVDQYQSVGTFSIKISVEEMEVNNMRGAVWRPVALPPILQSPWSSPPAVPTDNFAMLDYDLHAYTPDGRHVGMNYLTNIYEVEIPGAVTSGDGLNREWIFVPDNIEVYFTVSSWDVATFLENNPGVLVTENAVYDFRIVYFDENGVRYRSDALEQEILPGAEVVHLSEISQNPDGTYSIMVEEGMNLLSLEAWHSAIDNISDNIFIKNPSQRKNALKEKFEEIFDDIEEVQEELEDEDKQDEFVEGYQEAIEKLEHDFMEKLDADGKADWVNQPTLVGEIEAFIAWASA